MSDAWAPEDEQRSSSDRWVNVKQWEEVKEDGKTVKRFRFRVLTPVSVGLEGWTSENKPLRVKFEGAIPPGTKWQESRFNPGREEKPKPTWAFAVLDVDADVEKVWTITQATIKNAFKAVTAEWGAPFDYDLVCKQFKTSDGKTAYSLTVHPSGKCPLKPEQSARWEKMKADGFDLEQVWVNGNPFPSSGSASGRAVANDNDVPF